MHSISRAAICVLLFSLPPAVAHAAAHAPLQLRSPDGRAQVEVSLDAEGFARFAVDWNGKPVLLPSPLGVRLDGDDRIDRGLRVRDVRHSAVDSSYELVAGKTRDVRDHYRQMEVDLADAQGRTLGLVLRAYDDGIALRYRLPLPATGDLVVKEDLTGFLFPRDYACWMLNLGTFGTSHEGEYDRFAASPAGQGLVRAKTGTLTGVHSLAGTVLDAQGRVLVFVAAADRVDPSRALDAEAGLDAIAAALTTCSCSRTG